MNAPFNTKLPAFQTELEKQHTDSSLLGNVEPALMINPDAHVLMLIGAASARMQALAEPLGAWLCTTESDADPHEILRVSHHLAQEVQMLLDAVSTRVRAITGVGRTVEVSHG